jgi:nicotinamidase-related amidase
LEKGKIMIMELRLRSQALQADENGHNQWMEMINPKSLSADKICLLICDMWDQHWSRGAAERVNEMAPQMNAVVSAARRQGCHVIHAPSETLSFYENHPARQRMKTVPSVKPLHPTRHPNPPLPIDDRDGGSDTGEKPWYRAWTRQHPAIEIDTQRDVISDDGLEIYSYLQQQKFDFVLILGVHTNMCVLNRSFGIKQLVRWKVPVALVRDLTDTMYNPARSPYVSHVEGTRLVVEYIEKFWCPTVLSQDLTRDQ